MVLLDSKRTERPCIMIGSDSKRIVAGEEVVNERLRQLAAKHGVTVIILPGPTGRDPDSELRKFAEQFKQKLIAVRSKTADKSLNGRCQQSSFEVACWKVVSSA